MGKKEDQFLVVFFFADPSHFQNVFRFHVTKRYFKELIVLL